MNKLETLLKEKASIENEYKHMRYQLDIKLQNIMKSLNELRLNEDKLIKKYFYDMNNINKQILKERVSVVFKGVNNIDSDCDININNSIKNIDSNTNYEIKTNITHTKIYHNIHTNNTNNNNDYVKMKQHSKQHTSYNDGIISSIMKKGHTKDKYYCVYCKAGFNTKQDVMKHTRIHVKKRKVYPCDRCNKTFITKSDLREHNKKCKKNKTYSCHICKRIFDKKNSLEYHLRKRHLV